MARVAPKNTNEMFKSVYAPDLGLYDTSSTVKGNKLGDRLQVGEKVFYYCKNDSGSDITAGYLVGYNETTQSITDLSTTQSASAALTVGSTRITITSSSTTKAADLFAEGYLIVNGGTGAGQIRKIRGNTAAATATSDFDLILYDGLTTALDATSDLIVFTSPFRIKIMPTTGIVKAIGIPIATIANGCYGWVQTWGPAMGYGGAAVGAKIAERTITHDTTTAGELMVHIAGYPLVGEFIQTAATDNATACFVNLTIMP